MGEPADRDVIRSDDPQLAASGQRHPLVYCGGKIVAFGIVDDLSALQAGKGFPRPMTPAEAKSFAQWILRLTDPGGANAN